MAKNKHPNLTTEAGIWFGVNPYHMAPLRKQLIWIIPKVWTQRQILAEKIPHK